MHAGVSPTSLPPWLEMERYERIRPWFEHHALTLAVAWHCSLTVGLTLVPLLDALVRSSTRNVSCLLTESVTVVADGTASDVVLHRPSRLSSPVRVRRGAGPRRGEPNHRTVINAASDLQMAVLTILYYYHRLNRTCFISS